MAAATPATGHFVDINEMVSIGSDARHPSPLPAARLKTGRVIPHGKGPAPR
jgi:hypothetical protein